MIVKPAPNAPLPPLPPQPPGTPWPTRSWPAGPPGPGVDASALERLMDAAFSLETAGRTHAFLAVHRGRIVAERQGPGHDPEDTQPSWSMAKSITHALIGILAGRGLDVSAPADVPEWRAAGDPRAAITLDHLLHMTSGLEFTEDYENRSRSDVLAMLYGRGRADTAAFAASFGLAHPPGEVWSYSSGTSNIVSRCAARFLDARGDDFAAFMRNSLFAPLGMASARPRFDAAGTFMGSSFCFCRARDFARFGLLYLRGGVWEGRRILPRGWVDHARAPVPTPASEAQGYGAHWWLGLGGAGSFSANGYRGQHLVLVPGKDLILVHHGVCEGRDGDRLKLWLGEAAACFAG